MMTYPYYSSQPQRPSVPSEPANGPAAGGTPLDGSFYLQGGVAYPGTPRQSGASSSHDVAGGPGAPELQGTPGYLATLGYQGAPGYQGYSYPPGFPAAPLAPDPTTVNCSLPWFLGLLALVPVPFVSGIAGGLVPMIAGLSWKMEGATRGRTQARQAASWGLTYMIGSVVLTVTHFRLLYVYTKDGPVKEFFPLGIPLTLMALLTLLHLVLCVVGGVRAGQGKTMPFYGLPFFR